MLKKSLFLAGGLAVALVIATGCEGDEAKADDTGDGAKRVAIAAGANESGESRTVLAADAAEGSGKAAEHAGTAAEHAGSAAESGGAAAAAKGAGAGAKGAAAVQAKEGAEHAGTGAEHAGEAAGKSRGYTAEDIKAAMTAHIEGEIAKGGGALKIVDEKTGKPLALEFVKIHDPVRKVEGKGYFACTDFHPQGAEAGKTYDLDFWLHPTDGELQVVDTRIHKHPVRKGGGWEKEARYTFVNDNPVEVK